MDKRSYRSCRISQDDEKLCQNIFPSGFQTKYIVNQITDGMSEEERKKLYEYLIGEEKKLEMIKYIQNLLTKRKEKCTEIHNI